MQILQDILEFWPMMAPLSPALRHELQHELVQLAPVILAVGTALIAGAAVVAAKVGAAAFFPMFLFALFPFLMRFENRNRDPNSAKLQYGDMKARWKGSLAWGCLIAGMLLAMVGAIGLAKG